MITLTDHEKADIIKTSRAELVNRLIRENGDDLALISPSQAAGILDIRAHTLTALPIPRVAISPQTIKYRLSDITAFIESRIER
jgi:hypothetical protein